MTRISSAAGSTGPADIDTLNRARAEAFERFLLDSDSHALLETLSNAMDTHVAALSRGTLAPGLAVAATGGYGRREMFPYSDVDILFLYNPAFASPTQAEALAEALAEAVLYGLWDTGQKIGHAVQSLDEALALALRDIPARTSFLDARLIAGDEAVFSAFTARLREEAVEPRQLEFVEGKLFERDARHKRMLDSRYLLEPNIKEGKGGLRDLHTLYWIARHVYGVSDVHEMVERGLLTEGEYATYREAKDTLSLLRAHLHLAAGKAEERLTFPMQQALAAKLGYRAREGSKAVERLMKRYFLTASAVGNLTRTVCALLEEENRRKPTLPMARMLHYSLRINGFTLEGQRLSVWDEEEFARAPMRMLALFHTAQEHQLDIHPRALRLVAEHLHLIDARLRADKEANELFLRILLSRQGPEATLRRMSEVGLLGRFIPDFGRVRGLMQFNLYHTYTVDEHTLVALGILREIERGRLRKELPLASEMAPRIHLRRALYLALFCHDIAKGRPEDHSEAGEKVALSLTKRFRFSAEEARTSAWLVRRHLLFSHTAFKRDLADPKTIEDFCAEVQSVERLRLLLVMTAADIRAVGPGVWNAWKGSLMRELYARAESFLRSGRSELPGRYAHSLKISLHALTPGLPRQEVEAYLDAAEPAFLAALDPEAHAHLASGLKELREGRMPLLLDSSHDEMRGATRLIVCAPDQPALFSRLAGALALSGVTIASAQIFTLKDGIAADIFHVHDVQGGHLNQKGRMARIAAKLEQAVEGTLALSEELSRPPCYPTRKDAINVGTEVFFDNNASNLHTLVEVTAADRPGLLYRITHALSACKLCIVSAHIGTYGEQAVDVFYVKDGFGHKITHEARLESIRKSLIEATDHARP